MIEEERRQAKEEAEDFLQWINDAYEIGERRRREAERRRKKMDS